MIWTIGMADNGGGKKKQKKQQSGTIHNTYTCSNR